ncbi:MAG: PP2C family protein-serine/threonine phosphatase [Planctomycetota bacterium]
MKRCPACNAQNEDSAKNCVKCRSLIREGTTVMDPIKIIARGIQQQLEIQSARQKQLRTLPREPAIPGWEFANLYHPATAMGGDFYDFVPVAERQIGISIGDVSGHGVDAAFIMGKAMKALNIFGRNVLSPAKALVTTNADIFPDLDRQTFISIFYGVLDLASGLFRYAGAGHPPPFLARAQGGTIETLEARGVVLGMDRGPLFEKNVRELETTLQKGDVLLFFTDGITEAANLDGEQFGEDRLGEILKAHFRGDLKALMQSIELSVERFQDSIEQADDMTLLAVRRS